MSTDENYLDRFTDSYAECALWSSTDNGALALLDALHDLREMRSEAFTEDMREYLYGRSNGGVPLDGCDFSPEAMETLKADCRDFIAGNVADLIRAESAVLGYCAESAGHDFWLTRNGHGAGFWDRGLGEIGTRLSDASRPYGECYCWLDMDGLVNVE